MNVKKINGFLERWDVQLVRATEKKCYDAILEVLADPLIDTKAMSAEGIIFSMDRAIQLNALLESYYENVINPPPLHLFYRTTNVEHQKSYEEVIERFSDKLVSITVQNPFREKMIEIIDSIKSPKMFFLVDDDVFIEKMDFNSYLQFDTKCFVPSIRLAEHLNFCYTKQLPQPLPKFIKLNGLNSDWLVWKLKEGQLDWGYIFSIDGNVFTTREVAVMSRMVHYKYPNTYEAALGSFYHMFSNRLGVCTRKSKIVNIPCNMVQTEKKNKHGDMHQDVLLEKWKNGYSLDWRQYFGFTNISAHQDIPLSFIKRS